MAATSPFRWQRWPYHEPCSLDPALLVGSYHALGQTLFFLGDLIAAHRTVEQGMALFDPEQHRLANWSGGQPGEQCYLYGAFALWMLGYRRTKW